MSNRGREVFRQYKGVLNVSVSLVRALPFRVRVKLLEHFRPTRGKKGLAIRYILVKSLARTCGDNVAIFSDVYLFNPQHISLGDNVSIQPMCYVEGGEAGEEGFGVFIGSNVSIANGCTLIPTNHGFSELEVPIRDQRITPGFVRIDDNVWLGAKAVLLANVTVATGNVIAAGTIINRSTEPNGVYAGVPARRVKDRF